jgi:hypothetical protein
VRKYLVKEVVIVGHQNPPILTDHAKERMLEHSIDIHQVGIALIFGVGVVSDRNKRVTLLVGPDVTLVIDVERWNIATVYPNKHKHRFHALRAYMAQKDEERKIMADLVMRYENGEIAIVLKGE